MRNLVHVQLDNDRRYVSSASMALVHDGGDAQVFRSTVDGSLYLATCGSLEAIDAAEADEILRELGVGCSLEF